MNRVCVNNYISAGKLSRWGEGVFMKKIFVALSMIAFLAACDDSSSASAGSNDEPGMESSSSVELGSSSSEKAKSSSSVTQSDVKQSSSSEKTGKSSSSSAKSSLLSTGEDKGVYDAVKNTLTDLRDGQTYRTTTIKIFDAERGIDYSEVWMAENLNYETDNSFCYNDSAEYCEKYGRLYTWAAAMDSAGTWSTNGKGCGYDKTCSPAYPVRGVCPEGWHLPTQLEWDTLFTAAGGSSVAGTKLKSTSGWYGGNGTDAFSFSALPAGNRSYDEYYKYEGDNAFFWSSTELNSDDAYGMYLYYFSRDGAYLYDYDKNYGFSVRCVKD
jgi:uncharacterized protein (TIGR02145 family)